MYVLFLLSALGAAFVVAVFWLTPKPWRDGVSACLFLAILFAVEPLSTTVMFLVASATYFLALRNQAQGKRFAVLWLFSIPVFLIYSKVLTLWSEVGQIQFERILVPLGISYLTFRLIHYYVEQSRGRLRAHTFATFLFYGFFLPIYIAGPIQLFNRFVDGRRDNVSAAVIRTAVLRFILGFLKCFTVPVLAVSALGYPDLTTPLRDIFGSPETFGALRLWGWLILFTMYFYLNVSGYADMAIGASALFGLKITENFRNPFLARDFVEFWQRWHITLGEWVRRYIFIPLVKRTNSFLISAILSFTFIGAWHSLELKWIAWGLFQALAVLISYSLSPREPLSFLPKHPRRVVSSCIVILAFSFSMGFVIAPREFGSIEILGFLTCLFVCW